MQGCGTIQSSNNRININCTEKYKQETKGRRSKKIIRDFNGYFCHRFLFVDSHADRVAGFFVVFLAVKKNKIIISQIIRIRVQKGEIYFLAGCQCV